MLDDVVAQIVLHRVGIPGSGVQEALHALHPALANRLGKLPAVLALDAVEQTDEVAPSTLAHLDSRETMGDALKERIQCLRPPRDDISFCACVCGYHSSLL